MNIVNFAQFAGSPQLGMVFGHYYLAREWVKKGHKVTIVSAGFSHTRSSQPQRSKWKLWTSEEVDGIEYIWLLTPSYNSENKVGRMASILAFTLLSMIYAVFKSKVDTVIASSHHPLAYFPAKLLSVKSSCKLIFEVRDLWPLTLVVLGKVSEKNPVIVFLYWVEKLAYKYSDYTVSVLPLALPYMESKGLSPHKFVYVPNGVDFCDSTGDRSVGSSESSSLSQAVMSFREKYKYIIGYFGKIGEAQELSNLVDAFSLLKDRDIGLLIVGHGPLSRSLNQQVIENNLSEQVCMTGQVTKQSAQNMMGLVDICYLGLVDSPLFDYGVSPTKLNDYLFVAKPVIYAVNNVDDVLEPCQAIYFCQPTINGIHSRLRQLTSIDKVELEKTGASGREWAKSNRCYSLLAERFLAGNK